MLAEPFWLRVGKIPYIELIGRLILRLEEMCPILVKTGCRAGFFSYRFGLCFRLGLSLRGRPRGSGLCPRATEWDCLFSSVSKKSVARIARAFATRNFIEESLIDFGILGVARVRQVNAGQVNKIDIL